MSASNGTAPTKGDVSIDLTPNQIGEIIDNTVAGPRYSSRTLSLITLRGDSRNTGGGDLFYDKKLARSVIQGLMVLCAFADCQEHSTNEVANELDIPTSTVYRYVRTWAAVYILELDPISHLYRLAPQLSGRILDVPDAPREITT